ncbi:MAG: hypothetical protein WCF22_24835 [Candidatus Sulfotelmatobacter sp.]
MDSKSVILASLLFAACAYAQQPKTYLSGKLVDMDSVQCGDQKHLSNDTVETTNSVVTPAESQVCPEYVLESGDVTYRILSRNAKHPAPLPIGEFAWFRLRNGKMLLRVPALDSKEREYIVVAMTPRGQSSADTSLIRLNHLQ